MYLIIESQLFLDIPCAYTNRSDWVPCFMFTKGVTTMCRFHTCRAAINTRQQTLNLSRTICDQGRKYSLEKAWIKFHVLNILYACIRLIQRKVWFWRLSLHQALNDCLMLCIYECKREQKSVWGSACVCEQDDARKNEKEADRGRERWRKKVV